MQLEIFDSQNSHLLFVVDNKGKDFIIYNSTYFELSNDEILDSDISHLILKSISEPIATLRNQAWSSDCKYFFVFQKEGIYLFNVHSFEFILCKKLSLKFIEMYINGKSK